MTFTVTLGWWLVPPALVTLGVIWKWQADEMDSGLTFGFLVLMVYTALVRFLP